LKWVIEELVELVVVEAVAAELLAAASHLF
jgi:hypothetical protein